MVNKFNRIVDIRLYAIGHGHAYYPVAAQGLHAQRSGNAAVLAAGNAQHGIAALSVFLEPVAYPLYALVFYLNCIEHIIWL